ncbi:MAG: hypothetical protein ACQES9_05810, partial [Myxococcota bacterium]
MRTLFISLISIFALNFQAINLAKGQDEKGKEKIEFEDSSKDEGGDDIQFEDEEGPPTTGKVQEEDDEEDELLTDDIDDLGSLDD